MLHPRVDLDADARLGDDGGAADAGGQEVGQGLDRAVADVHLVGAIPQQNRDGDGHGASQAETSGTGAVTAASTWAATSSGPSPSTATT